MENKIRYLYQYTYSLGYGTIKLYKRYTLMDKSDIYIVLSLSGFSLTTKTQIQRQTQSLQFAVSNEYNRVINM